MKLWDRLFGRRAPVRAFPSGPCGMVEIAETTIRCRLHKVNYTDAMRREVLDAAREIGMNWRTMTVEGSIDALQAVFKRVEAPADVIPALV